MVLSGSFSVVSMAAIFSNGGKRVSPFVERLQVGGCTGVGASPDVAVGALLDAAERDREGDLCGLGGVVGQVGREPVLVMSVGSGEAKQVGGEVVAGADRFADFVTGDRHEGRGDAGGVLGERLAAKEVSHPFAADGFSGVPFLVVGDEGLAFGLLFVGHRSLAGSGEQWWWPPREDQ